MDPLEVLEVTGLFPNPRLSGPSPWNALTPSVARAERAKRAGSLAWRQQGLLTRPHGGPPGGEQEGFVFLPGANKNGWTTFKKLRSLVASMTTVSEENHQRGSFAETKITGCHDSTLLQLGKKCSNYQAKKNKTKLSVPLAAINQSGFKFWVR